MPSPTPDTNLPPYPRPSRCAAGVGRPYRAEIVAAARALFEGTTLPCIEIAQRIGIRRETVDRWSRRFGWSRPGGSPAHDAPAGGPAPGGRGRHPGRYGAAQREAARILIEETRLGWERMGLQLGIAPCTLWHWHRQHRWKRRPPPAAKFPWPARYRTRRGRPYAADAVGNAQRLVTTSRLSQAKIAAQVGVSAATLSGWIARRGWSRPAEAAPRRSRGAAPGACRWSPAGGRRTRSCPPEIVARARELFQQTELPVAIIGARVGVNKNTVWRWAAKRGWTRPRDGPDPHGRLRRGRRRARARAAISSA